jgi:hypothetical protein
MRDTFDLRQGYLNLHYKSKVQFFAGRQELKFGDERVIGISDWTNKTFANATIGLESDPLKTQCGPMVYEDVALIDARRFDPWPVRTREFIVRLMRPLTSDLARAD